MEYNLMSENSKANFKKVTWKGWSQKILPEQKKGSATYPPRFDVYFWGQQLSVDASSDESEFFFFLLWIV